MKRNAIAALLIIVFLGFTLFPASASGQMKKRPGRDMSRDLPLELEDFLNLTPEQKAQLKELRKARLDERQGFQEKMRTMRQDLIELMRDPEANEKKIGNLIDEMAKLRAGHFKSSLKHRKDMRKVFTPEQLEKVDKAKMRISRLRDIRFPRLFKQGRFFRRHPFFSRQRFSSPWRRGWR